MRKALGVTILLLSICIVQCSFAKRKSDVPADPNANVSSFKPVYSQNKKFVGFVNAKRELSIGNVEKKEVILTVDSVNDFSFGVNDKHILVDVQLPTIKSETDRNTMKVFDLDGAREVCEIRSYTTYRCKNKGDLKGKSQMFNVGILRFTLEENQLSIYHIKGGRIGEPLEGVKFFAVGIAGPYVLISFENGLSKLFEINFVQLTELFVFDAKKSFSEINPFAFQQDEKKVVHSKMSK